jgi:hypothetical protein
MKTKPLFHCLRLLFAAALLVGTTHAQNTAVPDYLSYQGRALNADGTTIGSGTPVNRTVTFRVWDHPSNSLVANLIYSEQQVVTISNGEFSALIGAGAATTGTALGYSESTKGVPTVKISSPSVFGAATRYLGVTIDDGTAAVDNEISPRQQFVTSSYAFRAKVAESVEANAISSGMLATGAVGSNQLAAASVTSAKLGTSAVLTANIGDSNVTTGKIADDNVTTAKIADLNVTTAKIADLNVTTAKIADLNVTTVKIADLNVTTGKIDNNAVDNTKLRDSAGLSVIGRRDSTTGDPADIVAGIEGHVLRRYGTSVGFGTVGPAGISHAAVTTEKIAGGSVNAQKLSGEQPGGAPVYGCRAWVNFDATRDTSGAVSTANTDRFIRASGNVSRVERNSLGDFSIFFTVPMSDPNYAAVHGWADTNAITDSNGAFGRVIYQYQKNAAKYRIKTRGVAGNTAASFADFPFNDVVIFR